MLSHFRSIRWTLRIWHGDKILVLALTGLDRAFGVSGRAAVALGRDRRPARGGWTGCSWPGSRAAPPGRRPGHGDDHGDWSPPGPFGEGPDDHRPKRAPRPVIGKWAGPGGPSDDGRRGRGRPSGRSRRPDHPAPVLIFRRRSWLNMPARGMKRLTTSFVRADAGPQLPSVLRRTPTRNRCDITGPSRWPPRLASRGFSFPSFHLDVV